ncbi:MAG: hypothetical protein H0U59_07595 [Gemmatimonadaceae bacterium]|nr:hypothetical protein [Gemmatimonadaceae bacterium]
MKNCLSCRGYGSVETWANDSMTGGTICTGAVRCTECDGVGTVAAPPWECSSCGSSGLINIGVDIILCPICCGDGNFLPVASEPEMVGV